MARVKMPRVDAAVNTLRIGLLLWGAERLREGGRLDGRDRYEEDVGTCGAHNAPLLFSVDGHRAASPLGKFGRTFQCKWIKGMTLRPPNTGMTCGRDHRRWKW